MRARDSLSLIRASTPASRARRRRRRHDERFREPVLIDADVETALRELTALAPLHQPKSLAALDAVQTMLPEVVAVACSTRRFTPR
jgi:acetate kinase